MVELVVLGTQTGFDIPKALVMGWLSKYDN